ncbi:putative transcriptional regulator [Erysiphe necator]|uniref:Putative transcriptional regulator n=1 Tax=Uncinula necator TaxID=52586 RepID=A0A0B1P656_UNCNE|nr:putative transcriptional regulator [Erysiphe necator]
MTHLNRNIVLEKLKQVTIETFHSADRDHLTVKSVRDQVEEDLELEQGALRSKDWKIESKSIIEKTVQQLLETEEKEQCSCDNISFDESSVSPAHFTKTTVKRQKFKKRSLQDTKDDKGPRKRTKKKTSSSGVERSTITHNGSSSSENEEESKLEKNKSTKPSYNRRTLNSLPSEQKAELSSEDELNEEMQPEDLKIRKGKLQPDSTVDGEEQSAINDIIQNGEASEFRAEDQNRDMISPLLNPGIAQTKQISLTETKIDSHSSQLRNKGIEVVVMSDTTSDVNDHLVEKDLNVPQNSDDKAMESDMSIVIDEEPLEKKRRKKKGSKEEIIKAGKLKKEGNKASSHSLKKNDKIASLEEMTLKKLQSQLRKCGVKKIWHFELKEYGEDTRAKINHLQKALKDIGMQGRFSEAKAREIKESRELKADLEAVKEGDMKWGLTKSRKNGILDGNGREEEVIHEADSEGELDSEKEESNGKILRNKLASGKLKSALQQSRRRSTALDWLGDEESSEG